MPTLEQAMAEAYTRARPSIVLLDTLELRHPSFFDESGNPTAARLVCDHADLVATLESSAPLNPGEQVTFVSMPFEIVPPSQGDGDPYELQISVDNVSREMTAYLEQAVASFEPIEATRRQYSTADTTRPHTSNPVTFTIEKASANVFRISATANLHNLRNLMFPNKKYDLYTFPALRYA